MKPNPYLVCPILQKSVIKIKEKKMEREVAGVLVPIVMFISMAVIAVYFILARLKERKSLIESGLSGDDLKVFLSQRKKKNNPYTIATLAIIAMGIGLALLIGSFVEGSMQEQLTFGMVLLFPGIGLFFLYMYMIKHEKEKSEE